MFIDSIIKDNETILKRYFEKKERNIECELHPYKDFNEVVLEKNNDEEEIIQVELPKIKNKLKEETKSYEKKSFDTNRDLIINVYSYIYDSFKTFSLVYDNFYKIVPDLNKVYMKETEDEAKQINVEYFLKKYRMSDFIVKINMLSNVLGKYNYEIFINDLIKKNDDFFYTEKESYVLELSKRYCGSSYDISYLKEFENIVKAERAEIYIFNDLE